MGKSQVEEIASSVERFGRYANRPNRFIKWETGREGGREALSCIVLLTLWFIILSCLGCCNKRPSHNILFNRSIVHAIRLHVSEVRFWKNLKFMRYCILISGGPLSALTCCVNVRLLSAIKKISPLIYSQSWVGSWVYTTQAMMTFTLIF